MGTEAAAFRLQQKRLGEAKAEARGLAARSIAALKRRQQRQSFALDIQKMRQLRHTSFRGWVMAARQSRLEAELEAAAARPLAESEPEAALDLRSEIVEGPEPPCTAEPMIFTHTTC